MTRRLIVSFAAASLIVTALGFESAYSPAAQRGTPARADVVLVDNAVPAQLQFAAKTLNGQDFNGESLLGRPAVLWFWAPWCPVCQREAPFVGAVAAANPGVTFVGVAAQDSLPAMQEFVSKYPVRFTHLADTNAAIWARFGVSHQPAYAFISPDGGIDVYRGSLSEAELAQRVQAL
jgi:thiol-disulfide isomerase/thioredoxin